MKSSISRKALLALALAPLLPPGAVADILVMKNGDRLTGTVDRMRDDVIILDTDYGKGLEITWDEVETLGTDDPVILLLSDNTVITATLGQDEAGRLVAHMGDEGVKIMEMEKISFINPPPEELDHWAFKGTTNLGINVATGNTETAQYHFDIDLTLRDRNDRFELGAQFNRETSDGLETASNANVHGDYNRFLTKKWYGLFNAAAETDRFKDLRLRAAMGPGIGYQFWSSDLRNLSLEGGINYVYQDFFEEQDSDYSAFRWNLDFDYYLYRKAVQFFLDHTGLQDLQDFNDLVLRTRTGFRFPINDHLSTTLETDIDYDREPAAGKEPLDIKYIVKGGYNW